MCGFARWFRCFNHRIKHSHAESHPIHKAIFNHRMTFISKNLLYRRLVHHLYIDTDLLSTRSARIASDQLPPTQTAHQQQCQGIAATTKGIVITVPALDNAKAHCDSVASCESPLFVIPCMFVAAVIFWETSKLRKICDITFADFESIH